MTISATYYVCLWVIRTQLWTVRIGTELRTETRLNSTIVSDDGRGQKNYHRQTQLLQKSWVLVLKLGLNSELELNVRRSNIRRTTIRFVRKRSRFDSLGFGKFELFGYRLKFRRQHYLFYQHILDMIRSWIGGGKGGAIVYDKRRIVEVCKCKYLPPISNFSSIRNFRTSLDLISYKEWRHNVFYILMI